MKTTDLHSYQATFHSSNHFHHPLVSAYSQILEQGTLCTYVPYVMFRQGIGFLINVRIVKPLIDLASLQT